jgi:hypothetical protein
MRSNGDDERFSARFSSELESVIDDESPRHDSEPPPERVSKAPKARAKKAAASDVAPKPSKKAPPKRAKSKAAPKSRRAKETAPPSKGAPPSSQEAPLSMDPRTTLRDHPGQQIAAKAIRTAVSSMTPPPRSRREDEISIPPTSSDPPGDIDERFFADGEAVHREHVAEAKRASLRPRALVQEQELETDVPVGVVPPERRKKLTNYVKLAMGFSAFLCVAAGIRVGVSHLFPSTSEHVASAAQVVVVAPVQPVVAAVAAPPPPVAPSVTEVPAAAPEEPVAPTKSAKEEKEDSRRLLEHGKAKDAIEAGARSVALDPTDAEAWLILGSAQQEAGHWKEGRESYTQCVKQAKVGPIAECRMMLH